jgi:hypothetical protein
MKRLAVTATVNLWVPDDRFVHTGALSTLATQLHNAFTKPLNEWASTPEFAASDLFVSVEVPEVKE